nr:PREDICTED: tensin-4 [Lepisosteus oculatus]XP_015217753.1 PREDICTED: tensin-4 [Lepisosteus oculatus]
MRPTAGQMSQLIPSHVLRVGQTICLSSKEDVLPLGRSLSPVPFQGCHSLSQISCSYSSDSWAPHPAKIPSSQQAELTDIDPDSPTLDVSLETLNQLILELDPSFEPLPLHSRSERGGLPPGRTQGADSPDEDVSQAVLVPRGCSSQASSGPAGSVSRVSLVSRSRPIPARSPRGSSCSPNGTLVFSSSPSASGTLPPLPCSRPRAAGAFPPQHGDHQLSCSPGALPPTRHRASASSLLSASPGSDTSYITGSCHSLLSADAESSDQRRFGFSGSFSNIASPYPQSPGPQKPFFSEHSLAADAKPPPARGPQALSPPGLPSSCPPSVASSLVDIPVLLVNGSPPRDSQACRGRPSSCGGPAASPLQRSCKASSTSALHGDGSGPLPSMKFVMDTSQFWFRPHITREEADALLRDREPGSFIVRDSTSYRGSFGLALKVQEVPASASATGKSGEGSTELVRHYLIESSARGVRLKGSSEEPYFGSLSALVYQHAITSFALPCKLLIPGHGGTPCSPTPPNSSAKEHHGPDASAQPEKATAGRCRGSVREACSCPRPQHESLQCLQEYYKAVTRIHCSPLFTVHHCCICAR